MENQTTIESRVITLEANVATIGRDLADIKELIRGLQKPKTTNWPAIAGFALALCTAISAFGAMWVNLRLEPIKLKLEYESVSRMRLEEKMDRELTWMFDKTEQKASK